MALATTMPNLRALAMDFLDRSYTEDECWRLVYDLLQSGGVVDIATDPVEAVRQVVEVWFCDDPRDPLSLVQPWDWYLMVKTGTPESGAPVGHIGLVIDDRDFIHVRRGVGVCIEPLRRWRRRLVQLARLRSLL